MLERCKHKYQAEHCVALYSCNPSQYCTYNSKVTFGLKSHKILLKIPFDGAREYVTMVTNQNLEER